MTDTERKDTKLAVLYELRLILDGEEKETFTKEELLNMLDTTARAKEAE